MFEYHGWAVIRPRYTAGEEEGGELAPLLAGLKQTIAATNYANHFYLHDGLNFMFSLTVSGLQNHRQADVIDVFAWLAAHGPGSYGLLFILDDEDPRGEEYASNFRVFRLARGRLQELSDPFLSPPIPMIEDAYESHTETNRSVDPMTCPIEIGMIVGRILEAGVMLARATAWSGDAKRSAIESDHIHNLPLVFSDYTPHHLHYYWEIERPSYIEQSKGRSLALFEPLWQQLEPLVASLPRTELDL